MQPEVEVLTDHNELICSSFIEHIANTLNLGVVYNYTCSQGCIVSEALSGLFGQ